MSCTLLEKRVNYNAPLARYSGAILDGYRYRLTCATSTFKTERTHTHNHRPPDLQVPGNRSRSSKRTTPAQCSFCSVHVRRKSGPPVVEHVRMRVITHAGSNNGPAPTQRHTKDFPGLAGSREKAVMPLDQGSNLTLDRRNSSLRAAKRMLQPPFQSNKVPLPAEPPKTIVKCVYFAKKRLEVHVVSLRSSSEPLSAIFLRLPGPVWRQTGEAQRKVTTLRSIYIYIASDRFEIRSITVGLAGARPK